jgi:hypothetical protein
MGGLDRRIGSVRATTRAATSGPSGGMREGRALSSRRPSMPSFMNRSCQRQTQVFDLPVIYYAKLGVSVQRHD